MASAPTVAIIDDDEDVREALCELLEVMGFVCRPFEGGSAFLAAFPSGRFDCVITDIRMPEINGLDVIDRLKELGAGTPVIVLTSAMDEHSRQRAVAGGACAYLMKPVDDAMMLASLERALSGSGSDPRTDAR
ncbi:response regulator receiver domain-containing protein [Novosphingobium sp. PhB55]|uniref:response regulator transcription factor n=1 Tax=Novosphingobium sp. PhB55 TaxID=2485106 RepID=UPI001065E8E0|nr:response regulator [Novosphingobium sp. PhB55]TDW67565.1 response regulator receiver domain-containing protein [Novosphingobium sp. PhB55]